MKLRFKLFFQITIVILGLSSAFAQEQQQQQPEAQAPVTPYEKVQTIYQSLEYNTIAFNDLKQKWVISDPLLIREIYNRFVVRDALREGGKKLSLATVKQKTDFIYNGTIVVDLRKRYYDDEIEFFAFVPESELQNEKPAYLTDPIHDPFLLRDIVGEKIYEKIRTQGYFYSNLTKSTYDTKYGYFYDVYLNLLDPKVTYWNTTSSGRNKYMVSLFGKWGSNQLSLPGWYSGEYIVGSELTYYQSISNDPSKYLYDIGVGVVLPAGRPFLGDFKNKKYLQPVGQALYFKASGDVLKYLIDDADGIFINIEGKYTLTEYGVKEWLPANFDTLYSVKSFGILEIKKKDLYNLGDLGNLEVGGGFATSDIYRYQLDPKASKLVDIDKKKDFIQKYRHNVFFNVGLSRTGGLIQHNISLQASYDTEGLASLGAFSRIMLSDQLGFDTRIIQTFGADNKTKRWRPDTYIVFSPILRINY